MTNPPPFLRRFRLPALFVLVISAVRGWSLPTAVNDSFTGAEDTTLSILTGGTILSANFNAGADGFTYADGAFGTTAANFESGTNAATDGDGGSGGVHVQCGPRGQTFGTLPMSGAWSRTFTAPAAGTYGISLRYHLVCGGSFEGTEHQDLILDIDGTRYGTAYPAVEAIPAGTALHRFRGDGNTGPSMDSGWLNFTQNIPLTAGNHTIRLGVYINNSSDTTERADGNFDNLAIASGAGPLGVLTNDTGVAPVTAVKDTNPAHGSVTLNPDGTFSYTPVANYSGPDNFTYHASDGTGNSAPATVNITVMPVNDAPVAANDTYSTAEDTPLTVTAPGVLTNDSDPDGTNPTAELRAPPAHGNLTLNPNGSFTFTPASNYNGPDSFTYRATDGLLVSADRTVSLTITPVADAPVAAADLYRTQRNTQLVVSLTSPVGQPTTTETLVAGSSTVPLGDPGEADLPVWRYLDNGTDQGTAWRVSGFNDSLWSTGKAEFGYGDDADGRPERTVVGYGTDPAAKFATTYFRTTFDAVDKNNLTGLTLELMRDDAAIVYLNGTVIYRDQSANGFPHLTVDPAFDAYANGTISNADEATLVDLSAYMTANPGQSLVEGTNVVAVEVHQGSPNSTDISMDLRLTAQRTPYAGVLYNDADPEGTALTASLVTGPAHGTLALNTNGTFTYTPTVGYIGPDSFVYRASDGALNSTNTTASITVVTAGNAPPVAVNDAWPTNEDTQLNVTAPGVLANDSDPESGALTAQVLTGPAHGTLTLNTNGSFSYTPGSNYSGPDSFTYRARDPFNANSTAATVALTVNAMNDAPAAAADAYGGDVGTTLNVSAAQGVLANDTDIEGTALTAQLVSPPTSGTLTLNANGSFSYTPPPSFSGIRTFTYRASDGGTVSNTVTVTITISAAPLAGSNAYSTVEDTPLTVAAPGVLANDSDPEGAPLTATNASLPAHGAVTLNANGSFTYTPATNYAGNDSFTYQAFDGGRYSAPATVTLTMTPVNDAPVAQADTYVVVPNQTLSVNIAQGILSNDSDAENSPLTLTQLSSPANGVLTLASNGSFTFVPNTGFNGTDSFTYRVSDGTLNSGTATVTLRVEQPGDDIVISEIMYRPGGGYPENTAREFIELHNRGTTIIDLTGWTISAGVSYAIPAGRTMAPGSYLAVAANVASFQTAYPGVTNVIGGWTGTLANGGEKIELTDVAGIDHDAVSYANEGDWAQRVRETAWNGWAWSTLADGGGRSIELRNPQLSNDNGQNWVASTTTGGTPGAANVALSSNIPPIIKAVSHSPAIPLSTDRVVISCELNDESPVSALTATLFWRDATTTSPGAFQSLAMSSDGKGGWFAPLAPRANLAIVEFYISASDGAGTRTWPAPTSEGQNANCQYQVSNEAVSNTAETVRLTLTAAENAAFAAVNSGSDRQFNQTLVIVRGQESHIRYRCDMRIRGNSSRNYQFRPLRISLPGDDDLDGITKFNLHPRSPHLQHIGMRLFQAAGLRAPDTFPVELRRNGVEQTTSSGATPDYGMWTRVEDIGGEMVSNQWPLADTGGAYKKGRNDYYWRATEPAPNDPDAPLDGWLKQNNSAANDWTDVTNFFSVWMAACAPHFPGSNPDDVAGSNGSSTSGNGNWAGTAFDSAQVASVETVSDLDQWARWFAVMTIIEDNETNVGNGQDDDYGAYFEPRTVGVTQQRRLEFIPHDLDTILGLGDNPLTYNARGLYDMTEEGSVFRPLLPLFGTSTVAGNAAFRAKYHNALRELLGTVFDADNSVNPNPPFYQFVDYHLANWTPVANRTAIKNFMTQRRTHLLGLLGAGATTPPPGTSNATVTSSHGTLFISEVLANNTSVHNNGGTFPDVIELHNTGALPVNLAGKSLTDDPLVKTRYVFPAGATIAAGARLALYADSVTAAPGTHLLFGLDNDGDGVFLYDTVASGQTLLDSITFGLQPPNMSICRTGAALDTWALCTPTIGAANSAAAALAAPAGVRINEWLGNADYRAGDDFIELYNGAAQPVAIGGMSLTDDFINYPARHLIPQLSFMSAGSFVEFEAKGNDATPGNARELPFNIDSATGGIALLGANGSIVDRGETLPQFRDVSIGRSPDGTGAWAPLAPPSPGYSNASLPDGALEVLNYLRITEMMYNPATTTQSEYVEFRNISDQLGAPVTLDLSGVTFTNGITFTFPAGTTLAPGAFLVIAGELAKFQAQFPTVPVGGTFTGKLDNSGEGVRYNIAGVSIPVLDFDYSDNWYPSTDGGGDALQIVRAIASPAMWDQREGWQATPPNPGTVPAYSVYAGPDIAGPAGVPNFLDGALNPGTFAASAVSLAWTRDSGPGTVTFTTGDFEDANATFSTPGIYVLRLTATAPGPVIVTDLTTVVVQETYDAWAARVLASQSAANRLPQADPDRDGMPNVAEFVLAGDPLNGRITGTPVPVPGGPLLSFTWQRNLMADSSIETIPELSTDLLSWQEGPTVLDTIKSGATATTETWTSTEVPVPGGRSHAYGRIRVVMP